MTKIENVCILMDMADRAGRKYNSDEVLDSYKRKKEFYGELGLGLISNLNFEYVSHKITNFQIENNNLFVDIDILDTPSGLILQKLFMYDKTFRNNFCLRGTGFVDKKWNVTELNIIAIDYRFDEKKDDCI